MTTVNHSAAAGIHPGAYHQTGDPGALGAGILWVDLTGGTPPYQLKIRNAGNTAWETVGIISAGGTAYAWTVKSANYTLVANDFIAVDTSGGAKTMTLPTAVGFTGLLAVMKGTSDANKVTIATTSSQTINGATSKTLSLIDDVLFFAGDNANWRIVGQQLGEVVQLNYTAASDLLSGATLTSTTWDDVGSNQSFTVDDANSVVEIAVSCGMLVSGSVDGSVASRLVIDSAGTPTNVQLGMGRTAATYCNPFSGAGKAVLTGLAVGSHTVKVQVYPNATTGTGYLRASGQPNTESLRIVVIERKR